MTRSRWSLAELNAVANTDALSAALRECCAAHSWVDRALAGRPYPDVEALGRTSDAATAALDDAGFTQALAAHPRIGARVSGRSGAEQAGMAGADDELRARLAAANAAYEERFGQVCLICATGQSLRKRKDSRNTPLSGATRTHRPTLPSGLAGGESTGRWQYVATAFFQNPTQLFLAPGEPVPVRNGSDGRPDEPTTASIP